MSEVSIFYSCTGFLPKCSILDIWKGSEHFSISEYTRAVNILGIWLCQLNTSFWIKHFMLSDCILNMPWVLNMLELHMILNKILHHGYLAVFWIYLKFWIGRRYTEFCSKQAFIHVWHGFEYSSDSKYARAWVCKGCE